MYKLRAGPAPITFLLHLYLAVIDAYCMNNHFSSVGFLIDCSLDVMERQLTITKMPLIGK